MLLQTHWHFVASVPRIVQKYWIALCKPKAVWKQLNNSTLIRKKVCLKEPCFWKVIWKSYSNSSPQLNNYLQDVQVPVSPKPCLKIIDRWPCFMKPFVFQKTPYIGKIPTKKVFPIVRIKQNFWCEALPRPKKIWKQWNVTVEAWKHKAGWK